MILSDYSRTVRLADRPAQAPEPPLLTGIFDQVFNLVPCVQSSVYLLDGGDLRYVASRGRLRPEQVSKLSFPLEGSGGAKLAMEEDRPVWVGVILEPIDNGRPRLGLIPFDPTLQGPSVGAKLSGNGTDLPAFMQPEQGWCTPNAVGIATTMSQAMQALSCPRCQVEHGSAGLPKGPLFRPAWRCLLTRRSG
jgi:hypothetical protein